MSVFVIEFNYIVDFQLVVNISPFDFLCSHSSLSFSDAIFIYFSFEITPVYDLFFRVFFHTPFVISYIASSYIFPSPLLSSKLDVDNKQRQLQNTTIFDKPSFVPATRSHIKFLGKKEKKTEYYGIV